jgi:hypothetical protein
MSREVLSVLTMGKFPIVLVSFLVTMTKYLRKISQMRKGLFWFMDSKVSSMVS